MRMYNYIHLATSLHTLLKMGVVVVTPKLFSDQNYPKESFGLKITALELPQLNLIFNSVCKLVAK